MDIVGAQCLHVTPEGSSYFRVYLRGINFHMVVLVLLIKVLFRLVSGPDRRDFAQAWISYDI